MFNPNIIKKDFPIFQVIHPETKRPIVYLDSAATSQKPELVIEAMANYYRQTNANVHRGIHLLSEQSTEVYERSRLVIANFFSAKSSELILTRNTTEAINGLVYGIEQPSDRVWASQLEHHSNFVPWQQICLKTGAQFEVIPIDEDGLINLEWMRRNIDNKVKVVAVSWVSNVLGSVQDINQIADIVHGVGAMLVIDAAQAAPHLPLKFDQLPVDVLAFSGHKMLAPMGVGGLLVKQELLERGVVKPWLFGGGMIEEVTNDGASFNQDLTERFTAGTPDVASVVGLAEACQYLDRLGMVEVEKADRELVGYALGRLGEVKEVKIIGPKLKTTTSNETLKQTQMMKLPSRRDPRQVQDSFSVRAESSIEHDNILNRVGSVAFMYDGVHAHDVAQVLESEGVAVRSGHHCAMPLHSHFGWPATVRASFQVYSTKEDVDALMMGLEKIKHVFG